VPVAQLVEQQTFNLWVLGSSPSGHTTINPLQINNLQGVFADAGAIRSGLGLSINRHQSQKRQRMNWLRLILAMIAFPISLMWYRKDIDKHRISPVVYWLTMAVYVAACVVVTVYAADRIMAEMAKQLNEGIQ
jgi:hypothetical protein